jgi:hypothetical protein
MTKAHHDFLGMSYVTLNSGDKDVCIACRRFRDHLRD